MIKYKYSIEEKNHLYLKNTGNGLPPKSFTCTKTVKRMTTMVVVMKRRFFGKSSIRNTREKQIAPLRPPYAMMN